MPEDHPERTVRFDALFAAHVTEIAAYCRWRARSSHDAEDALSETFLTAWRRLDDVPPDCREARVWLYATARRVTANQHRAARRRLGLFERLAQARPVATNAPASAGDDIARVREALALLSERDREVLLLLEWEELSAAEAAKVMGCSEGAVRGRAHRARRRLRKMLACEAGHDADNTEFGEAFGLNAVTPVYDVVGRTENV